MPDFLDKMDLDKIVTQNLKMRSGAGDRMKMRQDEHAAVFQEALAALAMARMEAGALVVEVNPEPSALTDIVTDCFLQGTAARLLPAFQQALNAQVHHAG